MKKLIMLIAIVALGISTIGCAEKKPVTPAPAPGAEAKPDTTPAPAEPAPATEDKK
ncbi:MAG: hypothetical protein JF612_09780 [Planctomycetia bacterium]|nr:hypothetical protein [Planctomycetia bacterium]